MSLTESECHNFYIRRQSKKCLISSLPARRTSDDPLFESILSVRRDNEINKSVLIRWKQQQHDILTTAEKKGASASNVSGAGRPSRIPKAVKDGLMSFIN
eukprot:scaffold1452_cov174-Amphora_coffeaeformis.AAC.2